MKFINIMVLHIHIKERLNHKFMELNSILELNSMLELIIIGMDIKFFILWYIFQLVDIVDMIYVHNMDILQLF